MPEWGFLDTFHLGNDPLRQHFAELDAPLIE
jgi:hypothetical protein